MADGDLLLYVGGSTTAFRCECGCNVFKKFIHEGDDKFHHAGQVIYTCNSCGAWCSGEKDDEPTTST